MRNKTDNIFIAMLFSNLVISFLLIILTVSVLNSLKDADKQRTNASRERKETLCILKIQPEYRTKQALRDCER